MNAVGFDEVDCGTLADSWHIQEATPVYVLPYVGEPQGMTKDERRTWFHKDCGKVIKANQVVVDGLAQAKESNRLGALFEDLPSGLMD